MKQRAAHAVALACLLGLAAIMPVPAQAATRFSLTVERTTIVAGQELVVRARSATPCDWGISFDGQPRLKRHTSVFVARFAAPQVTSRTRFEVTGICVEYGKESTTAAARSAGARAAAPIVVEIPRHWIGGVTVTVDPPGSVVSPPGQHHPGAGGSGLPNTGGPARWLLLLGLGCTVAGSVAVGASRRHPVTA